MKLYRLSETHIRYGLAGSIIPEDQWAKMPYFERPLYDPIDEGGTGFPYKVEKKGVGDSNPVLFYFSHLGELLFFIDRIRRREEYNGHVHFEPLADSEIRIKSTSIIIKYRKEWDGIKR